MCAAAGVGRASMPDSFAQLRTAAYRTRIVPYHKSSSQEIARTAKANFHQLSDTTPIRSGDYSGGSKAPVSADAICHSRFTQIDLMAKDFRDERLLQDFAAGSLLYVTHSKAY